MRLNGNRIRSSFSRYGRPVLLALFLVSSLAACVSYSPARYAHWDAKVRELCKKDGGVTVYERVKLTPREYQMLGGVGGSVSVPLRGAKPGLPYVAESKTTWLNEANPVVSRRETEIVRTRDGKVLSRVVHYSRHGQDFVSSYGCWDVGVSLDVERQTFDTSGAEK